MAITRGTSWCFLAVLLLSNISVSAGQTDVATGTPLPKKAEESSRVTGVPAPAANVAGNGQGIQPANCLSTTTNASVQVVSSSCQIETSSATQLGGAVTVAIQGLRQWSKSEGHDPRKLRLYLAGHMLPDIEPTSVNVEQGYINFVLTPHTSNGEERRSWIEIVEEARRHKDGSIPISVGPTGTLQPFDSFQCINLRVYPPYAPFVVGLLGVLLVALFFLGNKSQLLREGSVPAPAKAPYSLGRVQMAWWFYLVIGAYLYLWVTTGQVNTLTSSVLGLIGISAGTGLASIFVGQQKSDTNLRDRASLEIQQTALQNRITEIQKASPPPGSSLEIELEKKRDELAQTSASLASLPANTRVPVSHGLVDILRDGNGISFPRFQIVVWSIIMGIVFIRAVASELIMPEFDSTLLGLMGLSSGTYVGFKFPETPK